MIATLEEVDVFRKRIAQFESYIQDASTSFGVDSFLVKGVIWRESSGLPESMAWEGETSGYSYGLMGVTYGAATDPRLLKIGYKPYEGKPADLLEPETNIWYGTAYLKLQLYEYNEDIKKGLSAYNAGYYTTGNLEGYVNKVIDYRDLLIGAEMPTETLPTLMRGYEGYFVVRLQNYLSELGYSPGVIDGIFGFKTESAVKSFQSDQGLPIDGVAGPQTWLALSKEIAKLTGITIEVEKEFPFGLLFLGLLLLAMMKTKK